MVCSVKSILIASLLFYLCQCSSFPSYLTPCNRNDADLNACISDRIEVLRPHLGAGIPELGIPALNPLFLPKIELKNTDFQLTLLDNNLHHVDEFIMDNMHFDLDKNTLTLKLTFPRIVMDSKYEVKGRILVLDLDGKGPAQSNYTNVVVQGQFDLDKAQRKGKEYWVVKTCVVDSDFGRPVLNFENLFGDNKELNDQTMKVVNENVDQLVGDLQPAINEAVKGITLGIVERLIHKYSVGELFP